MMIGQVPEVFSSIVESVRPKIAIVRESDGAELWINPFEGRVSVPGHRVEVRFGDPPPSAYTNPATFFASGVGGFVSTPGWFGVPVWVWLAGGVAAIWMLSR